MAEPNKVLALSWKIGTEPRLYQQLAPNPYSAEALKIIAERFTGFRTVDVIKAVILAEQDGKYERIFKYLPPERQEADLYNQTQTTSELTRRLNTYFKQNIRSLEKLSADLRYEALFKAAFETNNLQEIELIYAQNQRISTKLLILDYVEKSVPRAFFPIAAFAVLYLTLIFFTAFIFLNKQSSRIPPALPDAGLKQIVQEPMQSQGLPVRLKIPKINIDAAIELVGVTSKGEMGIPSNAVDVGWFKLGPRPGQKGSAVIAGHFNKENGKPGVFADLDKLKEGDKLSIEDDKGTSTAFVVRESRTYNPGYADEVFSSSDSVHLNLITCDGVWNGTSKSYSKRLVVFTEKEVN